MITQSIRRLRQHFLADSLFRNSVYLMMSTGVMAAFGFIFWVVCSRLYSATDVGLATSLIAAASLMSSFGMLGFNNVIIRFLAGSERKNEQLSTAFILTSVASLLAAGAFLLWAVLAHSPSVQSSRFDLLAIIFFAYVLILTLNTLLESAFIAYRASNYVFFKNTILSISRLFLLLLAVDIGFIGIFSVTTLGTIIACCLGYFWLLKKFDYRPLWSIDKATIIETRRFAAGNYIGNLFSIFPATALILIVVSRLGAQEAAFFYMPTMIIAALNIIPSSMAQSLFAEVSHDESRLTRHLKDAIKHLFIILVPAVVVIWAVGGIVLRFFGPDYASAGIWPLRILALASLIAAANYFGDTLLNIKKLAGLYIFMNALNALIVVVLAYFMAPYGLVAVALASLIGQVATAIVYILMNWKLLAALRKVSPKET